MAHMMYSRQWWGGFRRAWVIALPVVVAGILGSFLAGTGTVVSAAETMPQWSPEVYRAATSAPGAASGNVLRPGAPDPQPGHVGPSPNVPVFSFAQGTRPAASTEPSVRLQLDVSNQQAQISATSIGGVRFVKSSPPLGNKNSSAPAAVPFNPRRAPQAENRPVPDRQRQVERLPATRASVAEVPQNFGKPVRTAVFAEKPSERTMGPERRAVVTQPVWNKPWPQPALPAQPVRRSTPRSHAQAVSFQAVDLTAEPPRVAPPVAAPPVAAPGGVAASSVGQLGPFEVLDHEDELAVVLRRSKLLRTNMDIFRTAVVDPTVCDVVQFTPREVSVIGRGQGATHVTFWFEGDQTDPVTYLVRVTPDPEIQERREQQYGILEDVLTELFPDSKVRLVPVADKLIVRGQAKDAAEAAQILAVVRGQAVYGRGMMEGKAADPMAREETNSELPATDVINMLRIPGVQQVALRVKIAELNRSAAREFGVDVDAAFDVGTSGQLIVRSLLNAAVGGGGTSILGNFDNNQINFGIHYLEQHGVVRMLSEPTLVTLSGRPASFVAGGEFAVPTTVGVGGVGAVTTDFRAFGAIITFVPTVLDKDFIRLEVAPEFSQIDSGLTSAGGTPGLSTRAVTTTVEMREGQTLAIAGLLDDSMDGDTTGDLPLVAKIFGTREMTREETELIILVTPELVHPMEPEAVPPLPGFDVTEPTNCEFFFGGRIEGRPTQEYRSTVWPRLRRRYKAGGPAMISGPFGHGD